MTAGAVPGLGKILTAVPERCTKVFALNVAKNVKFHSGQQETARSTAKSAGLRGDRQEHKTAVEESTPEKTGRIDRRILQKTLISRFWVS
jgi:hypothetical protein